MDSRTRRGWQLRALGILAAMCLTSLAGAAIPSSHAKVSNDLRHVNTRSFVDVIVQFKNTPGKAQLDRVARMGGLLKRDLPNIHGAVFHLTGGAVARLSRDPDVTYISLDRPLHAFLANAAPAV